MKKKGQLMPIVLLVGGLIALLILSIFLMIGWSSVKTATDVIIPEFTSIGVIAPNANVSEYAEKVLTPMDLIIQNAGLMIGLIYIIGILGLLSMAFIFRDSSNGWVIAFFVVTVIFLVMICIIMSNFYEEFYLSQDDIGSTLRDAGLASYLIIYSPAIMAIIAFIAGAILFSGGGNNGLGV